jgi:chromosomal replication initiator protein
MPEWTSGWLAARERLRRELGDAVFEAWIAPLTFISADRGEVKIGAPKPFARNWVANHYAPRIERALRAEGVDLASLNLVLCEQKAEQIPSYLKDVAPPHSSQPALDDAKAARRGLFNRMLHPAQTFESFISGPQTEFAFRAAQAFSQTDGGDISLLFVHGGFGYGKSHLANAAALDAKKRGRKVLYLSAEDFMRQFLGALHRKDTLSFKDELRAADLLIIDDLQHICGRAATMSEFLHSVNALVELHRKVMIVADKPPSKLDGLTPDVASRLSGGLVIAMEKPDRDTRLAILKARAAETARHRPDSALPEGVLERIADLEDISPREMLGLLVKLSTYADLTKKPVTIEVADETIGQRSAPGKKLSIEDIQRKTAEFYRLEVRDFHAPSRTRRVARPRQVAMFLSRQLTMRSLPEIGRRFGGRDHTTVLHACRRIASLCEEDPVFKQEVDFLVTVLSKRPEL